jgi:hypothetical protein
MALAQLAEDREAISIRQIDIIRSDDAAAAVDV